jgi:membrane protease YdiL (CAAX protease family)
MQRGFRSVALVGVCAGVWLLLGSLPWPARALTVFLLVPMPAVAHAQMKMLARVQPDDLPRLPIYVSSGITLWVLAIVTVLVASASGFTAALMGLRGLPANLLVAWTVFVLATAALLFAAGRYLGFRESPHLVQLLPRSRVERIVFVGLAITAGLCEEVVFRSFLIPALTVPVGSSVIAGLAGSVVFGFLHSYQRVGGAVRAGILGLALAIPFLASGSILPSILAHTVIDLAGGLFLGRDGSARGLQP